jgi:hypothetical protein
MWQSEASQHVTFDQLTNEPGQWTQTEEGESGLLGVHLARGLLSVDVENMSLLRLLEDIGQRCRIDILGKHILSDKLISAKLHNMQLDYGIRRLMRVSGVKNYALSYRNDQTGQHTVAQIVLFPEENEGSKDYYLARAEQESDSELPDHIRAEILEDFKAEVREEIPNELQD